MRCGTIRPLVTITPHDVAGIVRRDGPVVSRGARRGGKAAHTACPAFPSAIHEWHALFREVAARGKPVVNHVMALGGFDPPSETQQVDGIVELAAKHPDLTVVAYHGGGLDWERMLELAAPVAQSLCRVRQLLAARQPGARGS